MGWEISDQVSCHSSLRLERSSSNTWIGDAEGRYGGDDMIAEL
jgi:hypothetical protein